MISEYPTSCVLNYLLMILIFSLCLVWHSVSVFQFFLLGVFLVFEKMLYFQELDKYVIVFNKNVIVGSWNKASFNIIGGDCFSICLFLQIEGG